MIRSSRWPIGCAVEARMSWWRGTSPSWASSSHYLSPAAASHLVVVYQQGSVVCLERDAEGGWALVWMVRPELIARSFSISASRRLRN